ncbi:uncharacterized protein JCM10292_005433 [Rhodotorula paludigena]|uniref:uncharacterized protein n=1 Tax=Rhodotorula paludigena TaxID=86838 RepID=UPI00317DDF89
MPPRRSTRSTAGSKPAPCATVASSSSSRTLDLTRSSASPEPHKAAAERERLNADEKPARALQDEENDLARDADDGDGDVEVVDLASSDAGPSTFAAASSSRAAPAARRTSTRKRRLSSASLAPPAAAPDPPAEYADPDDPKKLLEDYRVLLRGEGGKCGKCGEAVDGKRGDTLPLTSSTPLASFLALSTAACSSSKCGAHLCKGCWEPLNADEGRKEGECCAAGKAIVLFEILASLDTLYLTEHLQRPSSSTTSGPAAKKRRTTKPPTGTGAGTGYGSGAGAVAYGYGGYGGYGAVTNGTGYALDDGLDDDGGEGGLGYALDDAEDKFWAARGDVGMDDPAVQQQLDEELERVRKEWEEKNKEKLAARKAAADAASASTSRADSLDLQYTRALSLLSSALPAPDAPTAQLYDFLPSPALTPLLQLSTLPDVLALLLRNDSVPEWQRRSAVYFAMLDVMQALGAGEGTLGVLFGERRAKRWSEGVGKWVDGTGDVRWERKVVREDDEDVKGKSKGKAKGKGRATAASRKRKADEQEHEEKGEPVTAASLYSLLKKLTVQAEAFRRAATSGTFEDADVALVGICGDFATAGERFRALEGVWAERCGGGSGGRDGVAERNGTEGKNGKGKSKGKGKGKAHEWSEQDWIRACGELAYQTAEIGVDGGGSDGGKTFLSHHYHREIASTASSRRPHNSFVHLAKELAVLSTSLPPGIWVRVDEARIDVIKCLIAGPEGSPYAHGLFEFDIFLPLQYPQVSPLCWLKTTGGNQCRFNPNLYAEGKVCLSLLGTWSGSPEEMWQPGKSTILQVLLSICSMILGTNYPFYNEPGFGAPRDDDRNKTYNKNCSLATTRWAMLDWIQGDKFKDSIWADVIASHFLLRRDNVLSTISGWAAQDARMSSWTPSLNATAGTASLEPYRYGAYKYVPPVANGDAAKKGKGKGKGKAAQGAQGAQEEKPAVPVGPPPRDLVKEVEEALDKLASWREEGWLAKLAAAT